MAASPPEPQPVSDGAIFAAGRRDWPGAGASCVVDAYRGFVMLLIMGEALQFERVAETVAGNAFWKFLAWHQTHVEWIGCSLHDLIQPSFSFLVGVALP